MRRSKMEKSVIVTLLAHKESTIFIFLLNEYKHEHVTVNKSLVRINSCHVLYSIDLTGLHVMSTCVVIQV